jgi:hypothetical protein
VLDIVELTFVPRIRNETIERTALVEPNEMNQSRGSLLKIEIK